MVRESGEGAKPGTRLGVLAWNPNAGCRPDEL